MADRVLGPRGSKRRRRFLFVPVFMVIAVTLFWVAGAQAVHDEQFQLDGDVSASTTTSVGGATQTKDWDSFFNSLGQPVAGSLTGGFNTSSFVRDFRVNPGCSITAQSGTLLYRRPVDLRDGQQGHPGHHSPGGSATSTTTSTARSTS